MAADARDGPDGVGLVGAGWAGQSFVTKLVRAGYEPVVFDVDEEALSAAVEAGASPAESPAEIADRADVVVLSLPGREAVESVMAGDEGVLETLGAGQVVVDAGTTPPAVDVHYQRVCHERDAGYVDCGMTRHGPGEYDEEAGPAYTMFVGGTREDYDRARPVIETLGYRHEFYEGIGNGHVVKAAVALRASCRAAIAAETVEFLEANGIDPEGVADLLEWDVPAPFFDAGYPSPRGFERSLDGEGAADDRGFAVDDDGARPRMRTSAWAKDPAYALAVARASNVYVPMLTAAYQTTLAAENYGAALLDRELAFNDSEWHHPSRVTAVYRALSRPRAEWRRLGDRWTDGDGDG